MFGTLNLTQSTAPPWEYSTNCWFTEKIRSQTRSSLNQEVACLFLEQLIHTINLQYLLNLKQLVYDNQGKVDRLSDGEHDWSGTIGPRKHLDLDSSSI